MKSKHLAKADFLRQLSIYATELYEMGDFTSSDPDRQLLSAKIEGFAAAGATIEVVTPDEVQTVIDKAHMAKFGEAREARRSRILAEQSEKDGRESLAEEVDWDVYDSPAKDRTK